MRKIKKYGLFIVISILAVMFIGCDKQLAETTTTTVETTVAVTQEETTLEIKNEIKYVTKGKIVNDDSVLGKNTYVFSTKDKTSSIQKKVDDIYKKQEANQFGNDRYSILFKPGEYDSSLSINVGYYTQVSGLGIMPTQTNINKLWVNADWMMHNATCNFWRSAENFSTNEYCMWANSQAVSLRRMNFNDGMVLSDGEGWSSGGFMADCNIAKIVSSGSQQQYLFRNDTWDFFQNGVWNMVFTGVDKNTIPMGGWPSMPYTKIEKTPVVQEKPYLTYEDENGYGVLVPNRENNTQGISWEKGVKGTFYGLNTFYIANPEADDANTINKALKKGKNILFTPGIYKLDSPLKVTKKNTIIYGMGLATLVANNGNSCMEIADKDGIKVCGLLFEAGNAESKTLLQVGKKKTSVSHEKNPICFSDVYFRVGGGEYAGKVQNCVTIECNNVIGDNFWVWRADHSSNVGWDVNTAPNGIIINGDNVTMYGLFVEHFQEYQTIWNGNGGKLYFYQSEMPYDVPKQKNYMSHNNKVKGYASFKISDKVKTFEGYGLGIYCYNRDADVEIFSGAEVPDVKGVILNNVVTVKLNGKGQITHVVNKEGNAVMGPGSTSKVVTYEAGIKDE